MQRYTFSMTDDDDDGIESFSVTYTPKDDFVPWEEPLKRFLRFLVMTGYIIDVDDFIKAARDNIAGRQVDFDSDFTYSASARGSNSVGEGPPSAVVTDQMKEKFVRPPAQYKYGHPDEWDGMHQGD